MLHSPSSSRAALLTDEQNTLKHAYTIEISEKDSPQVMQAYEAYLKKLRQDPEYASLSSPHKKQFDDKYQAEQFSNYQAFQKSAYGKLNIFAQPDKKDNAAILVLKFKTEEDAKEFLDTLQNKGIMCKIIKAPANQSQLRR